MTVCSDMSTFSVPLMCSFLILPFRVTPRENLISILISATCSCFFVITAVSSPFIIAGLTTVLNIISLIFTGALLSHSIPVILNYKSFMNTTRVISTEITRHTGISAHDAVHFGNDNFLRNESYDNFVNRDIFTAMRWENRDGIAVSHWLGIVAEYSVLCKVLPSDLMNEIPGVRWCSFDDEDLCFIVVKWFIKYSVCCGLFMRDCVWGLCVSSHYYLHFYQTRFTLSF